MDHEESMDITPIRDVDSTPCTPLNPPQEFVRDGGADARDRIHLASWPPFSLAKYSYFRFQIGHVGPSEGFWS